MEFRLFVCISLDSATVQTLVNSTCPIRQAEHTSNHLPSASQKVSSQKRTGPQLEAFMEGAGNIQTQYPSLRLADSYLPLSLASRAIRLTSLVFVGTPSTAGHPLVEGETGESLGVNRLAGHSTANVQQSSKMVV